MEILIISAIISVGCLGFAVTYCIQEIIALKHRNVELIEMMKEQTNKTIEVMNSLNYYLEEEQRVKRMSEL